MAYKMCKEVPDITCNINAVLGNRLQLHVQEPKISALYGRQPVSFKIQCYFDTPRQFFFFLVFLEIALVVIVSFFIFIFISLRVI